MMVDYSYLRPKKAAALQELHSRPFEKREALSHPVYENAMILPLRHVPGDTLVFGRGGVVDNRGEYVPSSAIEERVQYAYDVVPPPKIIFAMKKWSIAGIS
jgi:hypothetical protein